MGSDSMNSFWLDINHIAIACYSQLRYKQSCRLIYSYSRFVCVSTLRHSPEAVMNCLPTNLSIAAILIVALAILLARGVQGGGADFIDSHDCVQCKATPHHHTVRVHPKCYIDVKLLKCAGYCGSSETDFGETLSVKLKNSIIVIEDCSLCCMPSRITYQIRLFNCYMLQGKDKVNTGERRKMSVPIIKGCACISNCTQYPQLYTLIYSQLDMELAIAIVHS